MLQIVKQPENGGAGYVLVAVMDGDPGKCMGHRTKRILRVGRKRYQIY